MGRDTSNTSTQKRLRANASATGQLHDSTELERFLFIDSRVFVTGLKTGNIKVKGTQSHPSGLPSSFAAAA